MSAVHVPGMTFGERLRVTGAKLWQARVSYAMLAPFLAAFTVFVVVPVLFSFVLSFTQFNMVQRPSWVGFENYLRMFLDDRIFLIALQNTLVYAAITGPVGYLLSFLFAWLINEMRHRLRIVLTLLFYAPAIAGNAFMIWVLLFSPDAHGYINGTLIALGMITKPVQWLIDPDYMMPIVIGVVLWMSLGTSFLVFIAGLKGIDEFLYEAAAIDGIDNRWQELWYITLPAMRGYLLFGAIVAITESMTNTTHHLGADRRRADRLGHLDDRPALQRPRPGALRAGLLLGDHLPAVPGHGGGSEDRATAVGQGGVRA